MSMHSIFLFDLNSKRPYDSMKSISSLDFQSNNDSFLLQSKQISFEYLLSAERQEEKVVEPKVDNISTFGHSTAWIVANSLVLNPRLCYGLFERGTFNLYDGEINENSKFVRPYLPQDLRSFIKNMRVMNLSYRDKKLRCLHFPLQEQELRILLAVLSNLNLSNNNSKIYKNKLIFLMRIAGRAMEGRLSFDASRMLKDLINNDFKIKDDDVGIFSASIDHPVKIDKKMTIRTIPLSKNLGKKRCVALNNRILAISSSKSLSIIDTKNKRNAKFDLAKIKKICSAPNGNFLSCTKDGIIHEIIMKDDFGKLTMQQVTDVNDIIGDLKISSGGERNYAISNEQKTKVYTGIQHEYYEIKLDEPFIDFDVNNDDVYIATENYVEYYQWGKQYAKWKSPEQIRSISIDSMASSIGCCTKLGCYIIDLRSPHINAIGAHNCHNLVSLHLSPFLDIATAITENGIISFDLRQPDNTLSHILLSSSIQSSSQHRSQSSSQSPLNSPIHSPSSSAYEKIEMKGMWMPESRIFSLALNETFNIMCPYLKMPILESYRIPDDLVVSLHSNLELSVVQQENSITFIGGFDCPYVIPSVL